LIRKSIINALNNNSKTIRLPENIIKKTKMIHKVYEDFFQKYDKWPDLNDLARILKMEPGIIWNLIIISVNPIYYYILYEGYLNDDEDYERIIKIREFLTDAIKTLNPRERTVIEHRFGLGDGVAPMTLSELGEELGLTRQRISQIEKTALKKIEASSRGEELKAFFDTLNIGLENIGL